MPKKRDEETRPFTIRMETELLDTALLICKLKGTYLRVVMEDHLREWVTDQLNDQQIMATVSSILAIKDRSE